MNKTPGVQRLATETVTRRTRLGRTQEQLSRHGGPSSRAVRDIEAGRMPSLTQATLAKLDRGLGWRDGTAQRVLDGDATREEIDARPAGGVFYPGSVGEGNENHDPAVHDKVWDVLAEAVRHRRDLLQLRQGDLEARGGPSAGTVKNIEQAARYRYSSRTFVQLERALCWAPGLVQRVLDGTATEDEINARVPHVSTVNTAGDDEDARALRIGRAVIALLRELETP